MSELTKEQLEEVENKLEFAKGQLVLNANADVAFFATIVLYTKLIPDENIGTAGVTITSSGIECYYNPKFVYGLSNQQVVFLLLHEAAHVALMHHIRRDDREHRKWNYWCDAVINDLILKAGIGSFIDGGVKIPKASSSSEEELYAKDTEDRDTSSYGNGAGGYGIGDDLVPIDSSSPAETVAAVENCRIVVNQAANVARMRGELSENLRRMVDKIISARVPWYEKLRNFMHGLINDEYSWRRPSRRFISNGLYLPSIDKIPHMGVVVVAMDTSGSITANEIATFFGHLNRIIEETKPETVHLIYCDSVANYGGQFGIEDWPIKPDEVIGGGGTSFIPVFDMVYDMNIEPDVLIYLTDGYGDQSICYKPDYPVIWVSTDKTTDFTFGEVISLKDE